MNLSSNKRFWLIIGMIYATCIGYYDYMYQRSMIFPLMCGNILGIILVMVSYPIIRKIYVFSLQKLEGFILLTLWGSLVTTTIMVIFNMGVDIFLWAFWGLFYSLIEDPFKNKREKKRLDKMYLNSRDRYLALRWLSSITILIIASLMFTSPIPLNFIIGCSLFFIYCFIIAIFFRWFFTHTNKSNVKWIYFWFIIFGFYIEMGLVVQQPFYLSSIVLSIFLWFAFFIYNEY